ncbi:MAG: hypothetical protein C4292_05995 [Nitrososphaera sp.]
MLYDVPADPDTYFHRIGRTARAGAQGRALSLVTPDRLSDFERIIRHTKIPVSRLNESMGVAIPVAAHARNGRNSNMSSAASRKRRAFAGMPPAAVAAEGARGAAFSERAGGSKKQGAGPLPSPLLPFHI